MTPDLILAEIREANLSYLMLAQSLIRTDRDQALFRLGVNEDTAALIGTLNPSITSSARASRSAGLSRLSLPLVSRGKSAARSRKGCAPGRSAAWCRPMRWNLASISENSTPA